MQLHEVDRVSAQQRLAHRFAVESLGSLEDRIEAHLENGVLRLSLARPEEDKPRRITISG